MTVAEPINWNTATEQELRDADVPWPKSLTELEAIIMDLRNRKHDYGTYVYAMSIAATAAFYYMAHSLGVTGFQASCADMDVLRRTRDMKHGFRIVNFEELLYPQYSDKLRITPESLLADKDTGKGVAEAAKQKLAEATNAHPDVVRHWRYLVARYGEPTIQAQATPADGGGA